MKNTGQGRFRGVPFWVYKEQRSRGGRRVVRREYPLREHGGADDLGKKLPEHTFTLSLTGDDVQAQRVRLTQALNAPGPGELLHPDWGTLSVLVDNFESRYSVDNQRLVEFTVTVVPVADETAPTVAQDTAGVVNRQGDGTLASLFSTLADGWQTSLHDAQVLMACVNEKANTLESALNGLGLLADMQSFIASFTALRGNIQGLITTPDRLALAFKGIFQGIQRLPAYPQPEKIKNRARAPVSPQPGALQHQIVQLADRLDSALVRQDRQRAMQGLQPATRATVQLLQNTLRLAVAVVQVQMLSSLLTASLAAVSQNAPAQVLPHAASPAPRPLSDSGSVWLESTPDVVRVSQQVARRLDACALTTSALGYQTLALQVRALSRAFVADLSRRGVALPGLIQAAVTTTEPALVTLYRISGDARDTARFIRRNRLRHPLFVPGGERVEVLGG